MCYMWDKGLIRFPCVTRGTGNLNVSHVLHVGNFAILINMYNQYIAESGVYSWQFTTAAQRNGIYFSFLQWNG